MQIIFISAFFRFMCEFFQNYYYKQYIISTIMTEEEALHTITQFQSDKSHFRTLMNNFGKVIVFVFYAQSDENSKEFLENFRGSIEMFGDYENAVYFSISAQKCPETFKKYDVEKTPTVVFTESKKHIYSKHEDGNIGAIFDNLSVISKLHGDEHEKLKPIFYQKCQDLISCSPLIIFMKGTPTQPKCGFVRQLLQLLQKHNLEFAFYDIDADEDMKHWLRSYTKYKTYPQIYVNGKIIGGLDAFRQIISKDELKKYFPASCFKSTIQQKFTRYLEEHQNDTIALINGFPFESEQSKQYVNKLKNNEKHKQKTLYLWNIGLDEKMKEYIETKFGKKVPFIIQNKEVVAE